MNQILENLNQKADAKEVNDELQNLHDRIDSLEKALSKAKSDLKRAVRVLDDRVKKMGANLQDSIHPTNEDALFSRKPLEGISCASCEKGLTNMSGLPAQYYNWKRMPPQVDRVPMVGQGFSRIL